MTAKESRPRPDADQPLFAHIAWVLWARRNGGGQCTVCGQWAQDRPRTITDTMARALEAMYREGGTAEWVKSTSLLRRIGILRTGDDSKLVHWGLIETPETGAEMSDGKKTGWVRVTPEGEDFILGRTTVTKTAWLFNGKLLNHDGTEVTFRQCLASPIELDDILRKHHDR